MAVKIGHARIDENGKAYNGKAGNQTGKEVVISNWYNHSKGWVVLRSKDAVAAENIAKCMEEACANKCIGYDQWQRLTLYDAVKDNGFKCDSDSLKTNVETDCSALVRVCLAYAGIKVANFRTTNQRAIMMATGLFEEVPEASSNSKYLKRGDILVTRTQGHTVVVLTDGESEQGEQTVKVTLKVLKNGSKNKQVETIQRLLTSLGYSLGEIDGEFGNKTKAAVKKYQADNGLEADGVVGLMTWQKMLT
jgi:hypothetical protein